MNNNNSLCDLLLKLCEENKIESNALDNNSANDQPSVPINKADSWHRKRPSDAMSLLKKTVLSEFHFTKLDFLIIASLFQQQYQHERPISVVSLLRMVAGRQASSLAHTHQVLRLALDGIVALTNPLVSRLHLPIGMLHSNYIKEDILQGFEVSLSKAFIGFLIDEQRPMQEETPFESNKEFLHDGFRCCQAAQVYFNVPEDQWRIDLFDIRVAERHENLINRLHLTTIDIPFSNLISEYDLSFQEQLTLLNLSERESLRWTTEVCQVSRIIEPDQFHREEVEAVLSLDGKLRKNGLIEVEQIKTPIGTKTILSVEPALFRYIVSDNQLQLGTSIRDICKNNSAITISKPIHSLEHLILPEKEMRLLTSIIQSQKANNQQTLKDWGIIQTDIDADPVREEQRTIVLLSGKPGVGKTHAAEAIAMELGKELMLIDISQIQDKYVGESEKRLRSVFSSYQEYQRKSTNPPVLFLNECDQILSKRIRHILRSTDQMQNTMQNMLLEFLEQFTGVCIATTNLVTNLDPAFSRRFTHKIELPLPDSSTRIRLWNLLIPEALPMGSDFNAHVLAEEYIFSGSQIKTVIYNTAQEVANRPEEDRVVGQSDLIKYADLECSGSFDGSQVNRIGFRHSEETNV